MGYTHYWTISSTEEWLKTWPELLIDTRRIIQAAKVPLTRDGEDDTGIPPEITEKRIELNGDVNNSHEPFVLKPYATEFEFCKTAGKEYDIVVTAILLRAKMLAGNAIDVRCVDVFSGSSICRDKS